MNVLIFAHDCGLRGAERVAATQAEALLERGWMVTVVVPCTTGGLAEFLRKKGVNVIHVRYFGWIGPGTLKGRAYRIFQNALAIPKLIKVVRTIKPDIVYVHSIACGVGAIVARLTKIPCLWQIHETGPCGTSSERGAFDLGEQLSLNIMRWANCQMLAVSEKVAHLYERKLTTEQVGVLYQAVDVDQSIEAVDVKSLGRLSSWSGPKLVVVGSISELKDQMTAVRAMPEILRNAPNAGLFLIGDDPNGLALEIFETAQKLGVQRHVVHLGLFANAASAIACADCCIITSVDEGFGRVTVEAMLSETPIVASDVAVNREVAGDTNADYFEPSNPASLAYAVTKILNLNEAELRDRLIHASLYAREKFNRRAATNELENKLLTCVKR